MQTPEKIEKAFELYCANYSKSAIAKEFKVAKSTVSGWAKDNDWDKRKDEKDKQDAEDIRTSALEGKELLLELIDVGTRQLINSIKSGKKVLEPKDMGILVDSFERLTRPLIAESVGSQAGAVNEDIDGFTFDFNGMPEAERKEKAKVVGGNYEK